MFSQFSPDFLKIFRFISSLNVYNIIFTRIVWQTKSSLTTVTKVSTGTYDIYLL